MMTTSLARMPKNWESIYEQALCLHSRTKCILTIYHDQIYVLLILSNIIFIQDISTGGCSTLSLLLLVF